MMEEHEHKIVALDLAIERGMADVDAGRIYSADDVFDELEAELKAFPNLAKVWVFLGEREG